MKKRVLSILLCMALVITSIPLLSLDLKVSALTYGDYQYTVSNNAVTIKQCSRSVSGEVVIPSEIDNMPVETIGRVAFGECREITSIIIPNTVKTIEQSAFYLCQNMESISIPDSVTSIGFKAFDHCINLTKLVIPDSVTNFEAPGLTVPCKLEEVYIGKNVKALNSYKMQTVEYGFFDDCRLLQTVVLSEGLESIGNRAFYGCRSLTSIRIPDTVKTIGDDAFHGCSKLTNVDLGEGVEEVGSYLFYQAGRLSELHIPESLKKMGDHMFDVNIGGVSSITVDENNQYFCTDNFSILYDKNYTEIIKAPFQCNIKNYVMPDTVKKINYGAFAMATIYDNKLDLSDSLEEIEDYAFDISGFIKEIEFPESLKKIGKSAFYNTYWIEKIKLNEGIESIDDDAFSETKLTSVFIPKSLQSLGSSKDPGSVFPPATQFTVDKENPVFSSDEKNALYNKDKTLLYRCPDYPESFDFHIKTEIEKYAFTGCKNLEKVYFEYDLTNIPRGAFEYCGSLKNFDLPKSLESLSEYAFANCSKITEVLIPENVSNISSAFYGCSGLEKITLGKSVSALTGYAFSNCSKLKTIIIPDSIISIDKYTFYGCSKIADVYYYGTPEAWSEVSKNAEQLKNAVIHYNYDKEYGDCGESAEWSYNRMNGNLVITGSGATDSLESFDDYGWYSFKDSIEYVEIGDGITSLGANAFSACTNLKEVYCGDKLVDIGDNAFSGCSNLSTITFNSERISANNAFDSDAKLKIISPQNNSDARSLSAALNAEYIPYAFGEDSILSFNSTLHADSRSDYHFLTNLINKYKDAQYVHFKKLVFDDVKNVKVEAFDDIIIIDRGSDSLALNDLYINLSVVFEGGERNITFAEMIELLEKGEYDAFKLNIKSEEEETEKTIFQKIGEFFNDIKEDLIKAVSKTINFFVRIFKRR